MAKTQKVHLSDCSTNNEPAFPAGECDCGMPLACTHCGSMRLVYFRLDADWGTGGDLNRINPDRLYDQNDPRDRDELDIGIIICLSCD